MFVLMGNFQSSSCGAPSTNYVAVKEHFAALAAMICQHKNLMVRQSELPFSSSGAGPGIQSSNNECSNASAML